MRKRGDSPRDHAQRLGQLTRGRFGSASLPHIPPHLTCDRHAKNGANALTVAHLAWRSARSLKPRRKISEFYFVFHADILHGRSEEHTSELQSQSNLVCRLLLEKKKKQK